MSARISILLLLVLQSFCGYSQSVMDGVYLKEGRQVKDSFIDFNPTIRYIFPELKDSSSLTELKQKAADFSCYGMKAPIKLKDFTFFNYNLYKFERRKDLLKPGEVNFFGVFFHSNQHYLFEGGHVYPPSLRFHADTTSMRVNEGTGEITVTEKPVLEKYIEPFYFKNYEVTNKEYREFVSWVVDSIARRLLANAGHEAYLYGEGEDLPRRFKEYPDPVPIKWDKKVDWNSDNDEYRSVLQDMYIPVSGRYYFRRTIDPRKLNYAWYDTIARKWNDPMIYPGINIYPDTSAWIHDFPYSFNEPMTNLYFWHPAYDNYPVVGLTYEQVQAYLNWKQKMMQQELDNKKIKYRVELSLPSEIEWDIVSSARIKNDTLTTFTINSEYLWDESWLTDLKFLFPNGGVDTLERKTGYGTRNVVKRSWVKADALLFKDEKYPGHYGYDGYFHTSEANLNLVEKKKKNPQLMLDLDPVGISGMGGNVSEWMADTLYGSWDVLFRKRQQLLQKCGFPEAKLVSGIEMLYSTPDSLRKKSKSPRLVRGGNWFDSRSSFIYSKNAAGMHPKAFVSNSTARCTIGFRYIIKVYPK